MLTRADVNALVFTATMAASFLLFILLLRALFG